LQFEDSNDLLSRLRAPSIKFADLSNNKLLERSPLSKHEKKFIEKWEDAIEDEDENYYVLPQHKDDIILTTLLNSSYVNIMNENSLKRLNYNLKSITETANEEEDYKMKIVAPYSITYSLTRMVLFFVGVLI
jgi:hypothetical protein